MVVSPPVPGGWALQHLCADPAVDHGSGPGPGATAHPAPYARTAYEWNWNGQSAHVGALLLYSDINPATGDRTATGAFRRDSYTDVAVDGGYQFLGDGTHVATVDAIFAHETADLRGSTALGGSSQKSSPLNQVRLSLWSYYQQTYGLSFGWQDTWGKSNPLLYPSAPVTGSANGKPNSNAFILEADWIPFGKADSWGRPFANLKVGLQYHDLHTLQRRRPELRRVRPRCERQQHAAPVFLDGVLTRWLG